MEYLMFDFSKINMKPRYSKDFPEPATDEMIAELEQHCKHPLPEEYKFFLKNYNGGYPEVCYFTVVDEFGLPTEAKIREFFTLDSDKQSPTNIWWYIERASNFLGPNALPFADEGDFKIYYIKWVNDVPQIWFAYIDFDEPEHYCVAESFNELLKSLYQISKV